MPTARRLFDAAWVAYPPAAILLAAVLLLGSGCATTTPAAGHAETRVTAPPYPSHLAVRGTAAARAAVLYGRRQLDLVNLGDQPWSGGRVWLNGRYSAHLPRTAPGGFRHYGFALFLDADGTPYPGDVTREPVESIELQFGDELTRVRFGLGH